MDESSTEDLARRARPFVIGAVLAIASVAAVVSQFAFDDPDGLEKVAIDQGFADRGREHAFAGGVFADYATRGIGNTELSLAVAGITGATITLLVGYGIATASRRAQAHPA